jgi:hypothetical protein
VYEWCSDWFEAGSYSQFASTAAVDPVGPSVAPDRVLRGGGWGIVGIYLSPRSGRQDVARGVSPW